MALTMLTLGERMAWHHHIYKTPLKILAEFSGMQMSTISKRKLVAMEKLDAAVHDPHLVPRTFARHAVGNHSVAQLLASRGISYTSIVVAIEAIEIDRVVVAVELDLRSRLDFIATARLRPLFSLDFKCAWQFKPAKPHEILPQKSLRQAAQRLADCYRRGTPLLTLT